MCCNLGRLVRLHCSSFNFAKRWHFVVRFVVSLMSVVSSVRVAANVCVSAVVRFRSCVLSPNPNVERRYKLINYTSPHHCRNILLPAGHFVHRDVMVTQRFSFLFFKKIVGSVNITVVTHHNVVTK